MTPATPSLWAASAILPTTIFPLHENQFSPMTFRPLFAKLSRATALTLFFLATNANAQSVILHLRNGDRIAGAIISENTNEVKLSTVWSRELTVPVAQIESREIQSASAVAAHIATKAAAIPMPNPTPGHVRNTAGTNE